MKGRIIIGIVSLAVLGVIAAGAALATPPSGLVGTPLARGSAGEFTIHDKSQKLKLQRVPPSGGCEPGGDRRPPGPGRLFLRG